MSDQTLFEETPREPSLEDFVGEGKKYATLEDAANALPHAQQFIDRLKAEKEEMLKDIETLQEQARQGKTLEDVERSLSERLGTKATQDTPEESQTKPEDIEALLESRLGEKLPEYLKQYESSKTAEQNELEVSKALTDRYGDKAREALSKKAEELGIPMEDMRNLAKKSPKAVIDMFQSGQQTRATSGSVNTEALGRTSREGTASYYTDLRRNNPKEYWSPKTQQRMFQDRKRLGDAFYN
jgi:multidrug efflux pump subunit AcrB